MAKQCAHSGFPTFIVGISLVVSTSVLSSRSSPQLVSEVAVQTTQSVTIPFEVIAVQGNDLVVKLPEGTKELTVPEDFRFTVDGQQLSVHDLKPGMKGTVVITTTTTLHPVTVTEVNGTVMQAMGTSIIVRTSDNQIKLFSQGDIDKRGVKIMRGGQPAQISDFRANDKLTATVITRMPPRVLTEKEVQATSARAGSAPAKAHTPAPSAAAAPSGSGEHLPNTPPFPPLKSESIDDEARRALTALHTGFLAYNPTLEMQQGETKQVRAAISLTDDGYVRDGFAVKPTVAPLKVSATMSAELSGPTDQFEIVPITPKEQGGVGEATTWLWDVTPLTSGQLPLHLQISAKIYFSNGKEYSRSMVVKDAQIQVLASPSYVAKRFWTHHWEWILGGSLSTLLLSIVGFVTWMDRLKRSMRSTGESLEG